METKHILWALAAAAVAGGVYYWWTDSQKSLSPKPGQPNPVSLPTSNPYNPATPIPTSDGYNAPGTNPATAVNFASPFFNSRDTNPR